MTIVLLRDCEMPTERLLHPGEGCSCSAMDVQQHYKDEVIEGWEIDARHMDISKLKYREDYDITAYP